MAEVEPAMNLASSLVDTAGAHGDHVALRLGEATTTYRELDRDTARVAGLLCDRGTQPGDRVGIMLPNTPEFAVLTTACCAPAGSSSR
jgi:long-chain acyl-CoA synthetase